LLNRNCFFRREKKDVAKDLPSKDRQKMLCEITTRQDYLQAESDFFNWLNKQDLDDEAIARKMRAEILTQMNVLRQISARGKIPAAKEFIDEVMESGEKLIVFVVLKEIVNELKRLYPEAVTITGSDDTTTRQRNIDAFQTNPKTQLIICNIKAAGVGITLTASSRVLFLEYPWTYADCVQCEDRAHRIGQTLPVMCTYLLGEKTIDEKMLDIILTKKSLAQDITGATDEMEMSVVDSLVGLFRKTA
jgi:SWI/SNF-related matrix-associated actin-dependent regulator 1 of chromatin subfamily A